MKDIFFYEAFEEEEKALKHYLPDNITAGFSWKTIQETGHTEPQARIISVRTQSYIPSEWSGKIAAIITRSTGYDHIIEYRARTGVEVPAGYLPLYCNRSVAEQALLLWLALSRKLRKQIEQFKTFHRDGLTGKEIYRKSIAIIGVGNIGYEILKIARGLEMKVFAVDIDEKHSDVDYVSASRAISESEIIVCAMNLTEDNIGYFNYTRLKEAKKGALFINIARGELSPARDLLKLIEEGHLGGLALDVYDEEKALAIALREGGDKKVESEEVRAVLALGKKSNVILTPHNAFNTEESVERKSEQTVEQLKHYIATGDFKWEVEREKGSRK